MNQVGNLAILFYAATFVFMYATAWKIFTKAGIAGWKALVPIYGWVLFSRIAGKSPWMIFLFFIPLVGLYASAVVLHGLSKAFGKDVGFTAGLLFAPFLFYPILAFGKSTYHTPTLPPLAPNHVPQPEKKAA